MEPEAFSSMALVQEVKKARERELLPLPNVRGVGVGYKEVGGQRTGELAVVVYVERKVPEADLGGGVVPRVLGAATAARVVPTAPREEPQTITFPPREVPTDVQEIGQVRALSFTDRLRPVKPGYSLGHYAITAGTFGCLVRDVRALGRVYILSNNHVLANSNAATLGDPVLQPGPFDGGTFPEDTLAHLARFVPIRFNDPEAFNLVDAALAFPVDMRDVVASVVALGVPKGSAEATLDMPVTKSGRTTQTTVGTVTGIDVTVVVSYGEAGDAYFRNQTLTTDMSQGGDSGSLLLNEEGLAVGLLFAGSDVVTIHNNLTNVEMALGVEVVTV